MEGSYKIYISYELPNRLEWLCYDPDGMQWIDVPRQPEFSVDFEKTLAVGTELLVFGRSDEELGVIHKFRIRTNSWSLGGQMNIPRRHLFASASLELDVIHKFSILTNSWSLGREMNEPRRRSFGSASLGEIAIVAGGEDLENNILSSAEIYNSDTGTWESLPRMNIPRALCSGVFMDGNFYVVGGIGVDEMFLTCGEMYDLGTRTWHVIPNMLLPAQHRVYDRPPFLAVVENELYAAFTWENEVMKYDKGTNLWSTVGSLPEAVCRYPGGLVFSAYGDQLIVIVGRVMDFDDPSTGGIEVYECVPDEGPLQWNLLAFNYDEPGQQDFLCFANLSAVIARE